MKVCRFFIKSRLQLIGWGVVVIMHVLYIEPVTTDGVWGSVVSMHVLYIEPVTTDGGGVVSCCKYACIICRAGHN